MAGTVEQSINFVNHLNNLGMVVIKKADLEELLLKISVQTKVELKHKWLKRKEVVRKYGVTVYWLQQQIKDPKTLLKVDPGNTPSSPMKYQEQSVIDEMTRLGV